VGSLFAGPVEPDATAADWLVSVGAEFEAVALTEEVTGELGTSMISVGRGGSEEEAEEEAFWLWLWLCSWLWLGLAVGAGAELVLKTSTMLAGTLLLLLLPLSLLPEEPVGAGLSAEGEPPPMAPNPLTMDAITWEASTPAGRE